MDCTLSPFAIATVHYDLPFRRFDHAAHIPEAKKILAEKVAQGALKLKYHVIEGIREAPNAIGMLFRGENNGKLYVCLISR